MESKFFVAFQVCRYLLRFTKSISMLLQGSDAEIFCAYDIITFEDIRNNFDNEFHNLYSKVNSRQKVLAKLHLLNHARLVDRS